MILWILACTAAGKYRLKGIQALPIPFWQRNYMFYREDVTIWSCIHICNCKLKFAEWHYLLRTGKIIKYENLQLHPHTRSHLAGSVRVCLVRCWVFLFCPNLATFFILENVNCGAEVLQCSWALTESIGECLCGVCVMLETLVDSHLLQIRWLPRGASYGRLS